MKKLLSLLLLACLALGMFAGCGVGNQDNSNNAGNSNSVSDTNSDTGSEEPPIELVDYVAQVPLNMNNGAKHAEVTLKQHIDGDTSHFYENIPELDLVGNILKARYIAINTPESTGTIEPWGKKASNFTKEKLSNASSIIIETDGEEWETDSTGDRYLVWVWYKATGSDTYRNLNLEILQEGLAVGNKAGQSRYGSICTDAIAQAKALKVNCHSREKDPDFYYGDAIELTLKELRTNVAKYNGKRVAFEATACVYNDWNVYVEDFDEETQRYYGISVFYGYNGTFHDILAPGNRARIVGKVSYYEAGGTYQISDLKYDLMDPKNPNNTIKLGDGETPAYTEYTLTEFNSTVTVEREELDIITGETVVIPTDFKVSALAMSASISMKNLTVIDAYTTNNGGNNDGAISLTCKDDKGNQIVVRTVVLKDNEGNLITQDRFMGKTIDVKGIVDYYDGAYQIKVFWLNSITIH